jgi:NAD(P)-dependent dehydrogenase (short-subunit alcohol dehydrogenase family)
MRNAIVTGASMGLGRALALELARAGWRLTVDARRDELLDRTARQLNELTTAVAITGDVTSEQHRAQLIGAAVAHGSLDLIVNNASELGGSPPSRLRDLTSETLQHLMLVNVLAPQQLIRAALPHLAEHAVIINISSDAAIEHYEGWGGYAATKASLDHLTLTWAAEEPQLFWYAVDPGDLRTAMHQAAFPGQDISDRPEPESVAPALGWLIGSGLPSGRYRATELQDRVELEEAS